MDHVRLACSNRIYPTDVSLWPEIVKGLSQPIRTSQELSNVILRWNKAKEVNWNFNALDAFLNYRSDAELITQAECIIEATTSVATLQEGYASHDDAPLSRISAASSAAAIDRLIPKYGDVSASESESEPERDTEGDMQPEESVNCTIPLTSQFLSPSERTRFFDVVLPRTQALALRLPELIKKPIPFLKQQQDSAITLSQEQIACLNANAFFNTFPGRNVPYKTKSSRSYGRKRKSSKNPTQLTKDENEGEDSEDEGQEEEEPLEQKKGHRHGSGAGRGNTKRGGRGNNHGGRNGHISTSGLPPPPKPFKRTAGPAGQFDFYEFSTEVQNATAQSSDTAELLTRVEGLTVKENDAAATSLAHEPTPATDMKGPKMPSINLVSMFWSEQVGKDACTDAQAAKLRCLIHYFDRVTTEFQEEIRFMICPEMIVSRLFSQPMEANEAILIKGVEVYSDYIGYSKTFEWFADHRDTTPRDKLGRRQREICAIDARPFKSKASRIGQFDKHFLLREINKAIVGFHPSPVNASEWGLARPQDEAIAVVPRPIATGNWGCGAFGGHLQLKFVLQWIAASTVARFTTRASHTTSNDVLYYTFGTPGLAQDIEVFVKAVKSKPTPVEPTRLLECIVKYPRRSATGEAEKLREKSLLDYLASAVDY
ncbi:hypothetical protein BGZ94_004470 [Podila epigama]|nr:hypothetical protein BGZ94_004470 [Podila epigama]